MLVGGDKGKDWKKGTKGGGDGAGRYCLLYSSAQTLQNKERHKNIGDIKQGKGLRDRRIGIKSA